MSIVREVLDLTFVLTIAGVDNVDWESFACDTWPAHVKHINSPVSTTDLNRVCELARHAKTVRLSWSMGELYFTRSWQHKLDLS